MQESTPAWKPSLRLAAAHLPDIVEIPVGARFLLRHLPDLVEHRVKLESECFQILSQPETLKCYLELGAQVGESLVAVGLQRTISWNAKFQKMLKWEPI